jgi:hypothetical protein
MMISSTVYEKRLAMLRRGRRYAYLVFAVGVMILIVAFIGSRGSEHRLSSNDVQFLSISGIVVASFGLEFFLGRSISIRIFKRKFEVTADSQIPITLSSTSVSDAPNRATRWWPRFAFMEILVSPLSVLGGALLIGTDEATGYGIFFVLVGGIGVLHSLISRRHASELGKL